MPQPRLKFVKSILLVLLAWAVLVSVPRAGEAPRASTELTYQFEGTISWFNDPDQYTAGFFTAGDHFTGSFTISTIAPLVATGPDSAKYRSVGAPYGLSVNINNMYFGSNPADRRIDAIVRNDSSGSDSFVVAANAIDYGFSLNNAAIDNRQYVLFDFTVPRQCGGVGSAINKFITLTWTDRERDAVTGLDIPANFDAVGQGPGQWDRVDLSIYSSTAGFFPGPEYPYQQCLVFKQATIGGNLTRVWRVQDDTTAPTITCDSPDGQWHTTDVAIACTAADTGSGLENADDASFVLMTAVGDGSETADAATSTRQVCDAAGNCATAGPIVGNRIDKKAPTITVTAPTNGPYILGQPVVASYHCSDGGSGMTQCSGPVANGTNISTSAVGSQTFQVTATDAAGNTTTRSTEYKVNYNICPLYDASKARQSGSTIPIKIQLCDAGGRNVSSAASVVTAVGIFLVSTHAPGDLEDSGSANPDFNFRFTGDSYIFNLSLKGYGEGVYGLSFKVGGEETLYSVPFQVR